MNKRFTSLLFLLASLILGLFSACTSRRNDRVKDNKLSLTKKIGTKFQLDNLIDSSGHTKELNFENSDLTIVDFWFKSCPPCIEEMKQFQSLLNGKEGKVTIVSISVNNFKTWKNTLTERNRLFPTGITNWEHLAAKDEEAQKLGNDISVARVAQLEKELDVSFFPAFFVIDKEGTIIERPLSAVQYLKQMHD